MNLPRLEQETIINYNEAEATRRFNPQAGCLSRPEAGGGKARPQLPGRRAGIYRPETLGKGERLTNFDGGTTLRAGGTREKPATREISGKL